MNHKPEAEAQQLVHRGASAGEKLESAVAELLIQRRKPQSPCDQSPSLISMYHFEQGREQYGTDMRLQLRYKGSAIGIPWGILPIATLRFQSGNPSSN